MTGKPPFQEDQTMLAPNTTQVNNFLLCSGLTLRLHRGQIALAILALVLVAGALLGMGRGLAFLVDEGLGKRDPALLDRAVMATVLIAVVLAFGSYLRASMVNKIGEMVLADIRRAMFAHAITLSAGWFENARTGDVLSRITTDTSIVQTVMTSTLSMAARNFLLLVGGLIMVVRCPAQKCRLLFWWWSRWW